MNNTKQTETANDLTLITNKINRFDYFYEMSDSHKKYQWGKADEYKIKTMLDNCSTEELVEIKANITRSEDALRRYFAEYFQDLPEPTPPKNENLVSIMSTAWTYLKKGIFTNMSEALKAAWAKFKLVSRLKYSVVKFSYRTSNGQIRDAVGTLRDGNFEYEYKGAARKENPDVVKYFDLVSDGWRSFRIERLVA